MIKQVRFAPEASAELEHAARWYEQRHVGLGLAFLAAVDVAVEFVARSPGAGATVAGLPEDLDVRRARVSRFPYHLAYLGADPSTGAVESSCDRRR
ncbi:MAG: type II toxin-antitoxin system RelE/ParE family toxin [Acidimicrobiales bacterium]